MSLVLKLTKSTNLFVSCIYIGRTNGIEVELSLASIVLNSNGIACLMDNIWRKLQFIPYLCFCYIEIKLM